MVCLSGWITFGEGKFGKMLSVWHSSSKVSLFVVLLYVYSPLLDLTWWSYAELGVRVQSNSPSFALLPLPPYHSLSSTTFDVLFEQRWRIEIRPFNVDFFSSIWKSYLKSPTWSRKNCISILPCTSLYTLFLREVRCLS